MPSAPTFGNNHEEVTRQTADLLAEVFNCLVARGIARETAQRFTLQALMCLFVEDIGLLGKYFSSACSMTARPGRQTTLDCPGAA